MSALREQALRLTEEAARAGYPRPEELLALTPREVSWRLTAFAAGRGVPPEKEMTDDEMKRVLTGMGG